MSLDSFQMQELNTKLNSVLKSLVAPFSGELTGAIVDSKGELVQVIGSDPLHFATPEAVIKSLKKYVVPKVGELFVTNDPGSGNTRLCDLLFIQACYGRSQAGDLRYYLVLQIGVPTLLNKKLDKMATSIEDEGFRVPPAPFEDENGLNEAIVDYLCQAGISRDNLIQKVNEAKSSLKTAIHRLSLLETQMGAEKLNSGIAALRKYSEKSMKKAIHEIPDGEYTAHDFLDNDGIEKTPVRIQCRLSVQGENILVSFQGSSKQVKGPFNCNYAMTLSTCFWFFRCLLKHDIPINSGAFNAFVVEAPEGTIVNGTGPAPMLGGYYETSNRIADVLIGCLSKALPLETPALNGSSSNITLMKFKDKVMIDTLGSGAGASKSKDGSDAINASLHNTPASSIEDIESDYPIQVIHSGIRDGSGGEGRHKGGDGLSRGYKFLEPGFVMMLSDRRDYKPHGIFGGSAGLSGENILNRSGEKKKLHNEKNVFAVKPNDTLVINTPGGGAWGKVVEPSKEET